MGRPVVRNERPNKNGLGKDKGGRRRDRLWSLLPGGAPRKHLRPPCAWITPLFCQRVAIRAII